MCNWSMLENCSNHEANFGIQTEQFQCIGQINMKTSFTINNSLIIICQKKMLKKSMASFALHLAPQPPQLYAVDSNH